MIDLFQEDEQERKRYVPRQLHIDWNKVQTIEDIKEILKILDIDIYEGSTKHEKLKRFIAVVS